MLPVIAMLVLSVLKWDIIILKSVQVQPLAIISIICMHGYSVSQSTTMITQYDTISSHLFFVFDLLFQYRHSGLELTDGFITLVRL